jgi:integrase
VTDPAAVKKGTRKDGSTYYWFRASGGFDATGRRLQKYHSGDRRKDVLAEYGRVLAEMAAQRFVATDDITVTAYLDKWEPAHGRDLEDGSRAQLRHNLQPVRDRLGDRKFQGITRWDVESLVDWMETRGRKRGGRPGTPLGPRTIRLTLTAFSKACEDAVEDKVIASNPCRRVKPPKQAKPEHELWSDAETARFMTAASADRLHPVILLQCLGLRPEEVCGLHWRRDVKLARRTLEIQGARTLVDGKPVEKGPKTVAGKRTLPLDDALTDSLAAFHALQAAEKLAAGPAYSTGDYVLCNELGEPYHPARLRRVWYRIMREAGVRKITPYTASRHAAGSCLDRAGVSPGVIAAWLGHADPAFTMRTYVHARPEDLATARDTLARRSV